MPKKTSSTAARVTPHELVDALESEAQIEAEELNWRVIYSLFMPAVRLASLFGLPLREMKEWLGVAYLHELKRRGLSQQESAQRIDVSRRTIIELTRKLRENFFAPERHEGLARRVLFMLWAEPLSLGRLKQALHSTIEELDEEALEALLEELLAQEVLEAFDRHGVIHYALRRGSFRLYRDNWIARIDALNNQLEHLADTIYARFFQQSPESFVRTITLSMREEDVPELERLYREVIFPALVAFDEAAKGSERVKNMELSISWAPKDFLLQGTSLGGSEPQAPSSHDPNDDPDDDM